MPTDLVTAVTEHCTLFNSCVRSGEWAPFMETFAEDATLHLIGTGYPPVRGREGIARGYAVAPPRQTMSIEQVQAVDGQTARVRFRWASGEPGTMLVTWRDGQVAAVETSLPSRPPAGS